MAYQVLARKYRPQRFSDVVGQDHVTRTLLNALAQGRIAHGYIFSGHRGIGKTTIARILAMALNCRTEIGNAVRPTPEPCGVCESCTEVRAGNAVDVIEIDAATNRGIDEIRELRDAARYRPSRDRYKIYILDEAHQITDAAFNALLKTLEEPPDHVVFMMATTQPEDIPQTIRSRCQHFSFHAVKFDDILAQLRTIAAEEKIGADDEALALLAEAGDGSMRDALSIMDQAIASAPLARREEGGQAHLDAAQIRELMGSVPNAVFERLLEAIGENHSGPVVEEINRLLNAGNSASQLARQFVRYLRNVLMARIGGERTELLQLSPDERGRAARSALLFSEEDLTRFLGVMLRTFDELNYRQEPRFHLELGLLKLVHLQRLLPVEQLLSQLGGSASPRLGGGPLPGGGTGAPRSAAASSYPSAAGTSIASARVQGVPPNGQAGVSFPTSATPGTVVAGSRPSEAGRPAFSPFEADSRRKGSESSGPEASKAADGPRDSAVAEITNPTVAAAAPEAEGAARHPGESPQLAGPTEHALTLQEAPASPLAIERAPEIAEKPTSQSEAGLPGRASKLAGEPASAPLEGPRLAEHAVPGDQAASAPDAAGDSAGASSLDAVCQQVTNALEHAGHNTAAALLRNGTWIQEGPEEGAAIVVKVGAKRTMLGLTMNPEAERICREAMRSLAGGGQPRTLSFVPGEGGSTAGGARKAVSPSGPAGSVQALAMENPLVKQAQELFHAEVRSVVDLRHK